MTYGVFDGWLQERALEELRAYLEGYRYFTVGVDGSRDAAGTLEELAPGLEAGAYRLLGGRFVVRRTDGGRETKQLDYPSGTPLDGVLDSVHARLPELREFLGEPGKDWRRLGAGPRLYPRGAGLSGHDDADSVGTFVLYAHREWKEDWGGELEIGGTLVRPEPNRCVFVKGGTPHRVLPVSPPAGARLRMSVIGYARPACG